MGKYIRRGELYYADLEPVLGSEQGGERPVVVLQNDKGNRYSPTVIIAPLTTKIVKNALPVHVRIKAPGLRATSLALLEQIRTIDKQRIRQYIGAVSEDEMREIEQATFVSLGINTLVEDEDKNGRNKNRQSICNEENY